MVTSRADDLVTGGWTVDQLEELPDYPRYELVDGWPVVLDFRDLHAKEGIYARAGVSDYWLLDRSEPAGFTLMVLRPGAKGGYDMVESTHDVFMTTEPFPVTIDLPALTTKWRKRRERIRSES